jgi:hypothetical protein
MPTRSDIMTAEHRRRAEALRKALQDYLKSLSALGAKRDKVIREFLERIDKEHIEDLRAALDSL